MNAAELARLPDDMFEVYRIPIDKVKKGMHLYVQEMGVWKYEVLEDAHTISDDAAKKHGWEFTARHLPADPKDVPVHFFQAHQCYQFALKLYVREEELPADVPQSFDVLVMRKKKSYIEGTEKHG